MRRDPYWAIYALGDLDPRRAAFCEWITEGESILLVYREFDMPIVFAAGEPSILERVAGIAGPCFFQLPEQFLGAVEQQRELTWKRAMVRFRLEAVDFRASTAGIAVAALSTADHDALLALYSDGDATGEAPDFYMRNQLEDGAFFGVWDDRGSLMAAGGTHLLSESQSVGAIGNVYTARAARGRGYAKAVTSAIAGHLLGRGIRTVALNVKRQNDTAIRIYEQLGFKRHCDYWEAFAGK
ncbi:hypothetical protein F183_A30450 [Bryobacterales bacterium F-183]|nr:hypothetical protein F183_A30450 [Bryobacterales bacterium F-183]